jgi:hypothetical protein
MAEKTIDKYKEIVGFKEYPDCFYINTYIVNRDHWTEGFVKCEEAFNFLKNRDIVEMIINEWDPIGLIPPAPVDEYWSEIEKITEKLVISNNEDELAIYIQNIFVDSFNSDVFRREKEECKRIAKCILEKTQKI